MQSATAIMMVTSGGREVEEVVIDRDDGDDDGDEDREHWSWSMRSGDAHAASVEGEEAAVEEEEEGGRAGEEGRVASTTWNVRNRLEEEEEGEEGEEEEGEEGRCLKGEGRQGDSAVE